MKLGSTLAFSLSMLIFGSVGVFRKYIDMPSGFVAMVRGFVGVAFLAVMMLILKKRPSFAAIKKNLSHLILSGIAIGANWILLFESFNYTTVATATLCYYMAPVFVLILSPILFRERIGGARLIAAGTAIIGMVLVSEVWSFGEGSSDLVGILLALGAAILYASVTLINKKMGEIEPYDKTVMQLAVAAIVVLPYTFIFEDITVPQNIWLTAALLATIGIIHTGLAYALYFGSVKGVGAASIAVLSYLDPILSIILSAALLGERMTVFGAIGASLIIISTLFSELLPYFKEKFFKNKTSSDR